MKLTYPQTLGLVLLAMMFPLCSAAVLDHYLKSSPVPAAVKGGTVKLWKTACGTGDWGCELEIAYNQGWRP